MKLTLLGNMKTVGDVTFSHADLEFLIKPEVITNEIRTATGDGMVPHFPASTFRGSLRNIAAQVLLRNAPDGALSTEVIFLTVQGGKPPKRDQSFAKILATDNPVVTLFGAISEGPIPTSSKLMVGSVLFGDPVDDTTLRKASSQSQRLTNIKFCPGIRFPMDRLVRTDDFSFARYVRKEDLSDFLDMNETGKKSKTKREIEKDDTLDEAAKRKAKAAAKGKATHNQVPLRVMAIPARNEGEHRMIIKNPGDIEIGLLLHSLEHLSQNPFLGALRSKQMGEIALEYEAFQVEDGKQVGEPGTISVGANKIGVSTFAFSGSYLQRCYDAFTELTEEIKGGNLSKIDIELAK